MRLGETLADDMGQTAGEHACFARSGAGDYQQGSLGCGDGLELRVVEVFEQSIHDPL